MELLPPKTRFELNGFAHDAFFVDTFRISGTARYRVSLKKVTTYVLPLGTRLVINGFTRNVFPLKLIYYGVTPTKTRLGMNGFAHKTFAPKRLTTELLPLRTRFRISGIARYMVSLKSCSYGSSYSGHVLE